jgi:TonB family protein
MFDFVMSRNRQRRPAKRILASGLTSGLAHVIMLLLLIEYPELLRGGVYQNFRAIWQPPVNDEMQNVRTIAVLPLKMMMPSAESLNKLHPDSGKKGAEAKPIPIRLNVIHAKLSNQNPTPAVRLGGGNSPPSPPVPKEAPPAPVSAVSGTGGSGSLAGNQNDGRGGQANATLHPSEPEIKPVLAAPNVAPNKVPDTIISHLPNIPVAPAKNPNGQGEGSKARISDVIIDSDSKGFPMGEYTNLIMDLLKEKWLVPSYLKDSGHTTVHFYIDKNGRTWGAHILAGSGNITLDRAALSAALSYDALPALPKGYPGDRVGVRFVFSYNEH